MLCQAWWVKKGLILLFTYNQITCFFRKTGLGIDRGTFLNKNRVFVRSGFLVFSVDCRLNSWGLCCLPYTVVVIIQRLHRHHVSALVDAVDGRLQLHQLPQLVGHALTDLTGTTFKLPLLQRRHSITHTRTHSQTHVFDSPSFIFQQFTWATTVASLVQTPAPWTTAPISSLFLVFHSRSTAPFCGSHTDNPFTFSPLHCTNGHEAT